MDRELIYSRIKRLQHCPEDYKHILTETFSALAENIEERFDNLKNKLEEEDAPDRYNIVIRTAVCKRAHINEQVKLFPVCGETQKTPGYITTVFMECDYHTIRECLNRTYRITITTASGVSEAQAVLRYSRKYLNEAEALYQAFNNNEQHWTTINMVYFYKFLDVYCEPVLDEDIKDFEPIDFGAQTDFVSYDKELLWNIEKITEEAGEAEKQIGCEPYETKPAYNVIRFEYTIRNMQPDEYRYLVCSTGEGFWWSWDRQSPNNMLVRTDKKRGTRFEILRINDLKYSEKNLCHGPRSNKRKSRFIDRKANERWRFVPTHGDAERIALSFIDAALTLAGIQSLPYTEENALTYAGIDFNRFITERLQQPERKILLFSFKTDENKLWAHETMFFVLSELQLYFYEYRCAGTLV